MKKTLHAVLIALLLTGECSLVHAYELATHGRMTYEAFKRSVLNPNSNDPNDPQFLKQILGIQNGANPFGNVYYDISGDSIRERTSQPFEEDQATGRMPPNTEPLSIEGWLMRGAIREDDVLEPDNGQPVDDPYNTGNLLLDTRVLNHFYDPVHDWPLTLGVPLGKKAPDWAVGVADIFNHPNTAESGRRNHFTVFDARESMYRSLTGKGRDTSGNEFDAAPTKAERDKYWATLFRALGDIVHLVEDMAQPQHTRNDPHAGKKYDGYPGLRGHKSVYEAYIETRAAAKQFELPSGDKFVPPGLNYGNYNTPHFADYLSYFTTRKVDGDVMARRGLADYSNRGFFSAGKNLDLTADTQYEYPVNNPQSYFPWPVSENWLGDPFGGTMTLLIGSVADSLTGQTDTDVPLTAYGAWDQFLQKKNFFSRYTLVRDNYDAMANLLIPRAVAYSAGLIDYFFRGRLSAADVGFNNEAVTLRVVNAIDTKKYPDFQNEQLFAGGKLVVTREYTVSNEKRLEASDVVVLAEDVAPGQTSESSYTFNFPAALPDGVASVKFRLVFRGKLGQEEDAVAAGAIKPHAGFVVTPDYVPADGLGGARRIYQYAGRWMLGDETGLMAGNIDWKGWYVNGKPTRTLSWYGPKARYFPDWQAPTTGDGPFTPQIFQNGELYALAPSAVLGAALMKDANNVEWIVAICKESHADVAYRRPNRKSDNPALYDPLANPEGWQEIGSFSGSSSALWEADRPWFFNGAGTIALTMRWGNTGGGVKLNRLTATVGDVAQIEPQANTAIQISESRSRICDGNGGYGTYTSSSSGSSTMDVAVDYRDTEPVAATYSVDDANGSYLFSEVFSGSTFTRRVEFQPSHTEKISVSGGSGVIISSTTGTRKTVSTCDTTCNILASSNIVDTWSYIQYMDLRTGFISAWTQVVSEQVADSSDPAYSAGGELLSVLLTARSEQKMYHAGSVIEVNTNPADNVTTLLNNLSPDRPQTIVELLGRTASVVQTNGDVAEIQMYSASNLPGQEMQCGSTLSNNYTDAAAFYASYSVPNDIGHWAINSDNKLISVLAIKDYSPYKNTTRNFSYLSEGNLGQVIPTAPDNPWYYNIGVIH